MAREQILYADGVRADPVYAIDVDLERRCYATRRLATDEHAELWMTREPKGSLHLVRVDGTAGGSDCPDEPEAWDVDVFESLDEAEALGEAIDEGYDLHQALDPFGFSRVPCGTPKERVPRIEAAIAAYDGAERSERYAMRTAAESVRYRIDGVEVRFAAPWIGHHESMVQVAIVRLEPAAARLPRTWRRR